MNKILRLRGGAVSLSRESDKAERHLAQLQNARLDETAPQPAEPEPIETPRADKAIALIEATRHEIQAPSKSSAPIWSKAYQHQQAARRITENLKKNQAAHLAATASSTAPIQVV